ncbi:MAG: YfiR family protein [Burkholderiales bacterium]
MPAPGDEPGFAQHCGMIGFVRDGARLRFEVNLGALKRANLMLSSQVLSLATNVIDSAMTMPGRP